MYKSNCPLCGSTGHRVSLYSLIYIVHFETPYAVTVQTMICMYINLETIIYVRYNPIFMQSVHFCVQGLRI